MMEVGLGDETDDSAPDLQPPIEKIHALATENPDTSDDDCE